MRAAEYFEARGRSDSSRGLHWTRGMRQMRDLPQWARDAYIHGNVIQVPWKHILDGLPRTSGAKS